MLSRVHLISRPLSFGWQSLVDDEWSCFWIECRSDLHVGLQSHAKRGQFEGIWTFGPKNKNHFGKLQTSIVNSLVTLSKLMLNKPVAARHFVENCIKKSHFMFKFPKGLSLQRTVRGQCALWNTALVCFIPFSPSLYFTPPLQVTFHMVNSTCMYRS